MAATLAPRRGALVTLLIAILLVATGTDPSAARADADAPTGVATVPPAASAAWLADVLTDGERMVSRDFGFDEVDLTLDVLLGLAASGAAGDVQERVLAWFTRDIAEHIGTAVDATYVAATAKGALAVMTFGADPRAVGGVDLIALLDDRVGTDGRVRDRGVLGDLSSTTSQALAVLALARAGADPVVTARASTMLAGTACDDGGFPAEFAVTPCTSALTETALAVQALAAAGGHDDAVRSGAAAIALLLDAGTLDERTPQGWQHGLAAQALRAAGESERAAGLTDALVTALDGCDGQASGALLDPLDPVRATVGVLLASSGATLTTLDGSSSSPDARPLDCTPAVTDDGTVAADVIAPADDDAEAEGPTSSRTAPVLIALTLLVALVSAGFPLVRRARQERTRS